MWSKFGLKDIIMDCKHICYFKFDNEQGMNKVIECSPWMVNGKPLLVQKWDPDLTLEKVDPVKVPIWVKFKEVPLEAWNVKGLSSIASMVGKPMSMDTLTANMCHTGSGRAGFARIMIEAEADKGLVEQVEIKYKDKEQKIKECKVRPVTEDELNTITKKVTISKDDGFVEFKKRNNMQKESKDWTNEMFLYFKKKWEQMQIIEPDEYSEDVINDGIENVLDNELKGMDDDILFQSQCRIKNLGLPLGILEYSQNSCRIIVGWDDSKVNVMVISSTKQVVFCLEEIISTKERIYCSFVYACNKGKDRIPVWKDLELQKTITQNQPWFILGDFNVTRFLNEHSSGSSLLTEDMRDFNSCINEIEVEDINISGFHFTWTKSLKNPRCGTLKKLDRILVNVEVMKSIPQAHGVFLPYVISDHSPSILCIPDYIVCKPKSFRFMNYITEKEGFLHIVEKGWNTEMVGCEMYCLLKKLKGLKQELKKLNWIYGNTFNRVKELKKKVKDIQAMIDIDPHKISFREEASRVLKEYDAAKHDEFLILQQKTKIKWLSEEQFVYHFKQFLGKTDNVTPIEEMGNIFSVTLTPNEAEVMVADVSNEEIKEAIFDIESEKAAGPDGYTSHFFKKAWAFVGNDVCKAIKEFFINGELIGRINSTLISLIPKLETLNKVSDFRPIACCNVLYKGISKVIVSRIKKGLEKLVNVNQSAFIPGRTIQDNILVT
ncbi:uncharacterized protein [Rutidosis leptorrhynchoides]|uniref:uncharacterized protein n=1 Tax=Rutidosis leptorrhynchoides TaxID=125765 RepID=UPI003A992D61